MSPALVRRVEESFGTAVVAAAAAVLALLLVTSDPASVSPDPDGPRSPSVVEADTPLPFTPAPGRTVPVLILLLGLGVAGLGILLRAAARREGLPPILSHPPGPPPGWTLWDAAKPIGLFICTFVTTQALVKPTTADGVLLTMVVAEGMSVMYVLALLRIQGGGVHSLRLRARDFTRSIRPALKSYVAFLPLFYAVYVLNLGIYIAYSLLRGRFHLPESGGVEQFFMEFRDWPLMLAGLVIFVVVVAPVVEELFFRGLLQGGLRRHASWRRAAALSGVLFGVIHFDPIRTLPLIAFGIYLGWLRERSGGLALPILVHATNNLLMVALMLFMLL
jgi:membrane protease YdiL (CAAX protease family)